MRTKHTGPVFVFLILLLATPTLAAEYGMGLRAGTYGLGAEFGVGITPWFGLRAGGSAINVSETYEEDGIDYDGTLKLGGYGVWADFFPMKGTFRVTAGVLSNRNALSLEAIPTGPIDIGNGSYDPAEVGMLLGDVDFDSTVPYVGVGWGNVARGKRLGFLCDLGVVRQGAGKVDLRATAGGVAPEDIAAEAASIEDDLKDYKFWPVVSFGMSIRF